MSRLSPRISLNQLARYLSEPASRIRRGIVRAEKEPTTFVVVYYDPATKAICEFLTSDMEIDGLLAQRDEILGRPVANDYEAHRWQNNASAIDEFVAGYGDNLIPGKGDVAYLPAASNEDAKLMVNNVGINVRPDVVVQRERSGTLNRGMVKLYFSKDKPLGEAAAGYAATVAWKYATDVDPRFTNVQKSLIYVVDVFANVSYRTPQATTRRLQDVDAACQEIAAIWPGV